MAITMLTNNACKKHGNSNQANCGGKWIRPKKRQAIYNRDNNKCIYCLQDYNLTIDHLLPQQLGGTNAITNLVTACKYCNSMKGKKTLRQYLIYLRSKGLNTNEIRYRINRNKKRKLKGYNAKI